MGKTNKSILKRFKITKNGKFLRRPAGQNHFNVRAPGGAMRERRGTQMSAGVNKKSIGRYLGGSGFHSQKSN